MTEPASPRSKPTRAPEPSSKSTSSTLPSTLPNSLRTIFPIGWDPFDAARSSYLAGRGDFSSVVEDFNLWLDARVELARREADRYAAWAEIERLTGELP